MAWQTRSLNRLSLIGWVLWRLRLNGLQRPQRPLLITTLILPLQWFWLTIMSNCNLTGAWTIYVEPTQHVSCPRMKKEVSHRYSLLSCWKILRVCPKTSKPLPPKISALRRLFPSLMFSKGKREEPGNQRRAGSSRDECQEKCEYFPIAQIFGGLASKWAKTLLRPNVLYSTMYDHN